ncbi:MAG: aspartyl/asparaginyl beta-hydroxylase domain-containing protein [Alphaproteobacteria bacterium]|nr:aspartyl/asparaginyl beta-hydroxylase domain-containing protein [Alphaproteobacteria bacterium]
MSAASETESAGLLERIGQVRKRTVKRYGKRLIRKLRETLAQQSLVSNNPVLDARQFPDLDPFTEHWKEIRDEVREILKHREAVPSFVEVSPDQTRIANGKFWRTFILFGFGTKMEKNCAQAPVTTRLLEAVPNLQTAWFSIMAPHSHVEAHRGVTKSILRTHLGLIIPKDAESCRLRVDQEICVWREGEIFVFDDTYEHEVWNDTDEERVILLFDFDRPMRLWGRIINRSFIWALKFTSYYQVPKKNMENYEDKFEAATRQADKMLEAMSEKD